MALLYSLRHRFEELLFHSACQAGGIVMWRVILYGAWQHMLVHVVPITYLNSNIASDG